MNGFQLEKGRDYTTLDRAPIASIDQGGAIPRRVAHPKKSFPKRVVPPSDSFFNSLELPHRKLVGGGGGDGNVVGGDGGNSVSGESMAVSAVEGGGVNKRPPGKELSREVSPLGGQGGKSVGLGEIMQGGKEEVGRRYNDKDDDKEDDSVEEDD